jgi:hypothetical protein
LFRHKNILQAIKKTSEKLTDEPTQKPTAIGGFFCLCVFLVVALRTSVKAF